jgi:transposase
MSSFGKKCKRRGMVIGERWREFIEKIEMTLIEYLRRSFHKEIS